ncbi:MAG: SUMF1/EgtB/PvdO family nonheme iron enzyme [Verrucomicrobia bacterium]|nr:SUMF1/EgtB/PvdO family nonheme iron enzyme [Verrucomicrobiota bacterium]
MSENTIDPNRYEDLGGYRVYLRADGSRVELGRGGMGVTYRAHDVDLGREVVIKMMLPGFGDSRARERFQREAQSLAKVQGSEHVVTVFNLLRGTKEPGYVMEFLNGTTLERLVLPSSDDRSEDDLSEEPLVHPLSLPLALEYTRQAALGLNDAAKAKLVHRDIKPSNLMLIRVSGKARIKLIDFGLARVPDGSLSSRAATVKDITGDTKAPYTPQFASPEQIEQRHDLGHGSDIFSLGCTLWFLLTGEPPFGWNRVRAASAISDPGTKPDFDRLSPLYPPELIELLDRMLAKDPDDRLDKPHVVARRLEALLQGKNPIKPPLRPSKPDLGEARTSREPVPPRAERIDGGGGGGDQSFDLQRVMAGQGSLNWHGASRLISALLICDGFRSGWSGPLKPSRVRVVFQGPRRLAPAELLDRTHQPPETWEEPFRIELLPESDAAPGSTVTAPREIGAGESTIRQLAALIYELLRGHPPVRDWRPVPALGAAANEALRCGLAPGSPAWARAADFVQALSDAESGDQAKAVQAERDREAAKEREEHARAAAEAERLQREREALSREAQRVFEREKERADQAERAAAQAAEELRLAQARAAKAEQAIQESAEAAKVEQARVKSAYELALNRAKASDEAKIAQAELERRREFERSEQERSAAEARRLQQERETLAREAVKVYEREKARADQAEQTAEQAKRAAAQSAAELQAAQDRAAKAEKSIHETTRMAEIERAKLKAEVERVRAEVIRAAEEALQRERASSKQPLPPRPKSRALLLGLASVGAAGLLGWLGASAGWFGGKPGGRQGSAAPTPRPTQAPAPSAVPTAAPTPRPTPAPTLPPTAMPTATPRPAPTVTPTPVRTAYERFAGEKAGERRVIGGIPFRWCPQGEFVMGSPTGEAGRDTDEVRHTVTLTRGFWLAETEVTVGQWKRLMNTTLRQQVVKALRDDTKYTINGKSQTLRELWGMKIDSDPAGCLGPEGDNVPMHYVNWQEAQSWCAKLPEVPDGWTATLPTEAQWEYACRAGTREATPAGDLRIVGENNAPVLDEIAWYGGNSSVGFKGTGWDTSGWKEKQYPGGNAGPRDVAGKKPNAWGLHDMIGNVWEWCADGFEAYSGKDEVDPVVRTGANRVYRGGGWNSDARGCRSAYRDGSAPGYRYEILGFRPAVVPSAQ